LMAKILMVTPGMKKAKPYFLNPRRLRMFRMLELSGETIAKIFLPK